MHDNTLQDFRLLLSAENTAIIQGDYHVLDTLAARKLQLFLRLQDADMSINTWEQLARDMRQNQVLLGAAIKGVTAAHERIRALHDVRCGLQVYDRTGQFADLPVTRPELSKKA